jgi:hypothetical protein
MTEAIKFIVMECDCFLYAMLAVIDLASRRRRSHEKKRELGHPLLNNYLSQENIAWTPGFLHFCDPYSFAVGYLVGLLWRRFASNGATAPLRPFSYFGGRAKSASFDGGKKQEQDEPAVRSVGAIVMPRQPRFSRSLITATETPSVRHPKSVALS